MQKESGGQCLRIARLLVIGIALSIVIQASAQHVDGYHPDAHVDMNARPDATIVVDTWADETTNNGNCSLREALANANNNDRAYVDCAGGAGADMITFDADVQTVTLIAANGPFMILDGVTIDGTRAGGSDVTVSGGGAKSVFGNSNSGQTVLQHLTIVDGYAASSAGGIGGGIVTEGSLTLRFVTLANNHADNGGGGLVSVAPLTLDRVTISGNTGPNGAGILIYSNTATITHSTISGNTASSGPGGIYVYAAAGNATVALQASILADNGTDCALDHVSSSIAVVNADHSLVEASGNCSIAGSAGNLTGVDPALGALQGNGGGQPTLLPAWGSVVIDVAGSCNDVDQRGIARPQGAACDIGAVEVVPPTYHTLTVSANPGVVGGSGGVVGSGFYPDYVLRCGDVSTLCSVNLVEGTTISLWAGIPSYGGWRFVQWSGDCAGTASFVSVTMSADRHCIGTFAPYTVSGGLAGLAGSSLKLHLVVAGHPQDIMPAAGSTSYAFSLPVQDGDHYTVSVATSPSSPSQTCLVSNATGTGNGYSDIANVGVQCTTNTFTIAGGASNLAGSGLVLHLNGGSDLPITQNGYFVFPGALADASPYDVTVFAQPAGQTCSVSNASGTLAGANITDVSIVCSAGIGFLLTATVDDGLDYARYGQTLGFHIVVSNAGDTAVDNMRFGYSITSLDPGTLGEDSCTALGGAICEGLSAGAFLPPGGALTYEVTATVLAMVPDESPQADSTEFAIFALPDGDPLQAVLLAADHDTLVIFRAGFEP